MAGTPSTRRSPAPQVADRAEPHIPPTRIHPVIEHLVDTGIPIDKSCRCRRYPVTSGWLVPAYLQGVDGS